MKQTPTIPVAFGCYKTATQSMPNHLLMEHGYLPIITFLSRLKWSSKLATRYSKHNYMNLKRALWLLKQFFEVQFISWIKL